MTDLAKPAATGARAADILRWLRACAPWIAASLILIALPYAFRSGAALTTLSVMGIMIIFALSYNILLGQTGLLSFGHAVYYGLGAFFAAHAMNAVARNGLPIPLAAIPLVAGFAGLGFGIIFGWVSTKRGGTVFAMISLGLAELVASSANILRGFFGGEEGISTNRTKLLPLFGVSFGPQTEVYFLIAAWCLVCMIAMQGFTRTPLGRLCNAVRDNPERVQFIGYDPHRVRFLAFCFGSFFAGIAGGLAAINFEIVNSSYVGLALSGTVLLAAYIGGTGFFIGPIIGAVLVTYLQIMLSDVTEIWQLYFGLLFIIIVMFAPSGIAGLLAMHRPLWRAGVLHRLAPAYLLALAPASVMTLGAILLIQMVFQTAAKLTDGSVMNFLVVSVDVRTTAPWLVGALMLCGGFGLFRLTWPLVANAWNEALSTAHAGESAA